MSINSHVGGEFEDIEAEPLPTFKPKTIYERAEKALEIEDNQKNKRNANKLTLAYLIGKQYRETKKSHGGQIRKINPSK